MAVDVSRFGPWGGIRVNGFQRVAFPDGIAADGVVHVVHHVLIPPRQVGKGGGDTEGEVSIEELKERLSMAGLVEEGDGDVEQ